MPSTRSSTSWPRSIAPAVGSAFTAARGSAGSPLVAAAVLVRLGATANEAWRRVGEARGYPVPDNDEQRTYVFRYETRLHAQGNTVG